MPLNLSYVFAYQLAVLLDYLLFLAQQFSEEVHFQAQLVPEFDLKKRVGVDVGLCRLLLVQCFHQSLIFLFFNLDDLPIAFNEADLALLELVLQTANLLAVAI